MPHGVHWSGRWMASRFRLGTAMKRNISCLYVESNLVLLSPAFSLVSIPTELPVPLYISPATECSLCRLLSTRCRAAAIFSASGAALSQEVPTVT
jgi:hypothetical protein